MSNLKQILLWSINVRCTILISCACINKKLTKLYNLEFKEQHWNFTIVPVNPDLRILSEGSSVCSNSYGCIHLDQTDSIQERTDHTDDQSHEVYTDTGLPLVDTPGCKIHTGHTHRLNANKEIKLVIKNNKV